MPTRMFTSIVSQATSHSYLQKWSKDVIAFCAYIKENIIVSRIWILFEANLI